mmetsp:Transcript_57926/g.159983  ORF Transcript_57926/g.159983 Transcript_57926/m.159983 type:complete len:203 (-) Transcript_57926:2659-3267(-)
MVLYIATATLGAQHRIHIRVEVPFPCAALLNALAPSAARASRAAGVAARALGARSGHIILLELVKSVETVHVDHISLVQTQLALVDRTRMRRDRLREAAVQRIPRAAERLHRCRGRGRRGAVLLLRTTLLFLLRLPSAPTPSRQLSARLRVIVALPAAARWCELRAVVVPLVRRARSPRGQAREGFGRRRECTVKLVPPRGH